MKGRWMRSFHARIFVTVICVALVPIVLCLAVLLPVLISSSERRQAQDARTQLAAISERLGGAFDGMDRVLRAIAESDDAIRALDTQEADERAVYTAMVNASAMTAELSQLYLFSEDGECAYALRGAAQVERLPVDWGVLRMASEAETVFCAGEEEVFAVRRMADGAGYALASLGGDELWALLDDGRDPAAGIMLLDARWRLIAQSQTAASPDRLLTLRDRLLEGLPLEDEESAFVYTALREEVSGFTLLLAQPRVFSEEMTGMLAFIGAMMAVLSLALCLWGALVLSRYLSRPVREMTAAMEQVERGELSVRLAPRENDELGVLATGFNRMVEEYEQNLRRTVERQKELNDTRIRMMQAQLNPHFLYNTLDSMKWMGVTHGVPQVAALAEDLAGILRTSISGEEFVTLGCELELLERYIDIQLIRFEDRFACEIEVDDALMRCMVPKMVLQPIVENAVIHGVRDMDDGYIKIWAERCGGDLCLYVQDNGRGMDSEQDGALGDGVSGRPGEHLGMYNVNSILRLHFGGAYGLSVRSRPGEGCLVMVRMPMKEGYE
ncbi:MAG: sensor histidine kinase [Clostridia bacterium]|nr:sensor histidine kinase [Clostridia bacterium]